MGPATSTFTFLQINGRCVEAVIQSSVPTNRISKGGWEQEPLLEIEFVEVAQNTAASINHCLENIQLKKWQKKIDLGRPHQAATHAHVVARHESRSATRDRTHDHKPHVLLL